MLRVESQLKLYAVFRGFPLVPEVDRKEVRVAGFCVLVRERGAAVKLPFFVLLSGFEDGVSYLVCLSFCRVFSSAR